jgi:DNA-binding IclR family transcriptional regulator
MNSLRRMLAILKLIRPDQPTVDIAQICAQLAYAPATAYRYVRELADVGLLVRLPGGYALGPRIIELDLLIRETDPLLHRSQDLVLQLAAQTGLSVLLSELYEDTVISIHQEFGLDPQALNFGRGRPMPLFRSATSRVILAHLPSRRLRRVYEQVSGTPDSLAIGDDWTAFSRVMASIRKQGWCLSRGELDPGKTGLAAPIFDDKQRVMGSVTLVGSNERFASFEASFLRELVCQAGEEITRRMAEQAAKVNPVVRVATEART